MSMKKKINKLIMKTYEGFLNFFKKPTPTKPIEIKIYNKEELIDEIKNGNGAYFKYNFEMVIPFVKSIMYDEKIDKFLLINRGKVSRIRYTFEDLVLYAQEENASIIKQNNTLYQ